MKDITSRRASVVPVRLAAAAIVLVCVGCQPTPTPVNPDDPEIVAAIAKAVAVAMDGAANADAERALSVTTRDDEFTFITGDTMITGYDEALRTFRETYGMLQKQTSEVISTRVRVLAPDVVLVTAVTQGTYTDKAGFTSEPVGLGSTIVFVRRNGEWRAVHFHQSVAK